MIKAIETRYKGYRFRSRLEARWAVFFDTLGLKWEYEKEGFDLGQRGYYLPDFWLKSLKCWIEIKPEYTDWVDIPDPETSRLINSAKIISLEEVSKTAALCRMTKQPVCLVFGTPWECRVVGSRIEDGILSQTILDGFLFDKGNLDRRKWLERGFTAARSARFEHGESGAPVQ